MDDAVSVPKLNLQLGEYFIPKHGQLHPCFISAPFSMKIRGIFLLQEVTVAHIIIGGIEHGTQKAFWCR